MEYTEMQMEEIMDQADEWGLMFEMGFPGTKYDPVSKTWDFSGSRAAIDAFGATEESGYIMHTANLACLHWQKD